MSRVLTSWRVLAAALVVAVSTLVVLVVGLERLQAQRTLEEVSSDAQLISELLLEVNLRPEDGHGHALSQDVVERIGAGVDHLKHEGQLVGLQLHDLDGHVLYSDSRVPDPLTSQEGDLLAAVLAGNPQVEFEHDDHRQVPTASVLIQPEDDRDDPSGLIAEVLLPQQQVAAELTTSSRWLYGTAGAVLAALVAVSLVLRRRMLRREHDALHDPLTGLGNRALLLEATGARTRDLTGWVSGHRRSATTDVALLLLDLDAFKTVNDTLGHAVGDRLLIEVAQALRTQVRPQDVVVRLGGDEFAVLVRELPDPPSALRTAQGISAALHRPFVVDEVSFEVGVSIGVAFGGGEDVDELMRRADVAMYQAKRDGGGARLYEQDADLHDPQQLKLLSQLRAGIDDGELELYYQPKLALREDRVVGFEALVRWRHPQLGLLAPATFLPLAERTALMRPLTTWVLREAITQCAQWRAHGWDVDVAVNITPAALLETNLPTELTQMLADAALPSHGLALEVTETAVMTDPTRAAAMLRRLQAIGITVSIDDFGAGHTSLSYLKSLPVHALKIDRGFITTMLEDVKDEAVTRSVISLSHDLGLTVIAEGVETSDVRRHLLELGCDEIQGYHLARPMPGREVHEWLTTRPRSDNRSSEPTTTAPTKTPSPASDPSNIGN